MTPDLDTLTISDDDFCEIYGGLVQNESGDNIEIDFDDADKIEEYIVARRLWTAVEGTENDTLWLLPGIRWANRISFYISSLPWSDADLNKLQVLLFDGVYDE